jgi:ribosome recycling factor
MEEVKKAKDVSEDEVRRLSDRIQKLTDEKVAEIDGIVSGKEQEITQI